MSDLRQQRKLAGVELTRVGLDEVSGEPTGEIQKSVMTYLSTLGSTPVTDLARYPKFKGVHFARIEKAVEALAKKGLVTLRTDPQVGPMVAMPRRGEALGESDVSDTIVQQMGGFGRLKAMIGAKVFKLPNGIGIKWPNKERSRGNYVEIRLEPSDTYTMEFFNQSGASKKSVKVYDDVYFDSLVDIFERQTGWFLSLGGSKKPSGSGRPASPELPPVGTKHEAKLDEMASPKSRKLLWVFLKDLQAQEVGPKLAKLPKSEKDFSNETFGKQSFVFFSWESPDARKAGERLLKDAGFKVDSEYWPGSATSSVQVSYFKGWHWDESRTSKFDELRALLGD